MCILQQNQTPLMCLGAIHYGEKIPAVIACWIGTLYSCINNNAYKCLYLKKKSNYTQRKHQLSLNNSYIKTQRES